MAAQSETFDGAVDLIAEYGVKAATIAVLKKIGISTLKDLRMALPETVAGSFSPAELSRLQATARAVVTFGVARNSKMNSVGAGYLSFSLRKKERKLLAGFHPFSVSLENDDDAPRRRPKRKLSHRPRGGDESAELLESAMLQEPYELDNADLVSGEFQYDDADLVSDEFQYVGLVSDEELMSNEAYAEVEMEV